MKKTYVITGATGNTGKPLCLELLQNGHNVRAICRNSLKAQELKATGAEILIGDTLDESFLQQAFAGADATYVLLPIDAQAENYTATQVAHATAIKNAVVKAGIKYAVTLSSVGAHLTQGSGVVLGLHKMEELFNAIPNLNVKHLRASYFMENTLSQIQSIQQYGLMATPVKGDVKFAMVAAKDIAERAAKYLLSLDFIGKSIDYVLGERDISYNEVAENYGKAIAQPSLKYVQLSYEEFFETMSSIGMGESAIEKFTEFTKLINEGAVQNFYTRTPENTTPTSIEQFATTFKNAYESSH